MSPEAFETLSWLLGADRFSLVDMDYIYLSKEVTEKMANMANEVSF